MLHLEPNFQGAEMYVLWRKKAWMKVHSLSVCASNLHDMAAFRALHMFLLTGTCRGRGQVLAFAAAADAVVLVTSRSFYLRYDLSSGTTPGPACALKLDCPLCLTPLLLLLLHAQPFSG